MCAVGLFMIRKIDVVLFYNIDAKVTLWVDIINRGVYELKNFCGEL